MIASPCCGSCDNLIYNNSHGIYNCRFAQDLKKLDIKGNCISNGINNGGQYSVLYPTDYSPRNPIQSKHEKMWDDLKSALIKNRDDTKLLNTELILSYTIILKTMKKTEELYNANTN